MSDQQLRDMPAWKDLSARALMFDRPEHHLKHLVRARDRLARFSLRGAGLFFDFSRQRVDAHTLDLLFALAETRGVTDRYAAMVSGQKVNLTEQRAALHMASRRFDAEAILLDGVDVMPEIRAVRNEIKAFSEDIRSARIVGSTGKPFKHVVVIGIGGSYLGTEFVATSLQPRAGTALQLHFLSNVDIQNFGEIVSAIDPAATLWVVISKSYTTPETMANAQQAVDFMVSQGLSPAAHMVSVTSKGSPGDKAGETSASILRAFHMFDYIGGRYSVTSAVGGVPLSLYLGYDSFERFLKGAEEMDLHTIRAPLRKNMPLMAALISVWNNNFLGYGAQAIIPYATPLRKLAPHIQQLSMESNGKSVTADGRPLAEATGTIIFGEPGTNAQHSFFQLAHQGRPFPIDFIGVLQPHYHQHQSRSQGVTNHQELWANLISQPEALALGKADTRAARCFQGNRPSSTLLLEDLAPENIGRLLAFYEAKTIYEAFLWGINPFDQFGVELGKKLADGIRGEIAARNANGDHDFGDEDPIKRFYLETLFAGKLDC